MRILLVHPGPDFSVADVFNGWTGALKGLGHDVQVYNTNERLSFYAQAMVPDYTIPEDAPGGRPLKKAFENEQAMVAAMQGLSHALYTFWPDIVIMISAFYTSAQTFRVIRARKHKVVVIHTESPYQDDEQLIRAQFADVNLLNDPVNLDEYKMLVPNSHYMPHAYDPAVHYPRVLSGPDETGPETDFAFIGTLFKSRKDFFEGMLRAGAFEDLKIAMGGAAWDNEYADGSPLLKFLGHPRNECVDNTETANTYRRTRSGINFYRRESEGGHQGEGWAMGPREVEMAACGVPFVRDPRPESDEVFPFLPRFDGPEEAAEQLKWLLAGEDRRLALALRTREAIKDRTFKNNAIQLMKYLEKS